jgi:hypothetical protein
VRRNLDRPVRSLVQGCVQRTNWCCGVYTDMEANAGIPRSEVVRRSPIFLVKRVVPQQLGTGIEYLFRDNTAGLYVYDIYGILRIGTCQLTKRKLRIYVLERAFRVNLKLCSITHRLSVPSRHLHRGFTLPVRLILLLCNQSSSNVGSRGDQHSAARHRRGGPVVDAVQSERVFWSIRLMAQNCVGLMFFREVITEAFIIPEQAKNLLRAISRTTLASDILTGADDILPRGRPGKF